MFKLFDGEERFTKARIIKESILNMVSITLTVHKLGGKHKKTA
jgi:hypothetical protein